MFMLEENLRLLAIVQLVLLIGLSGFARGPKVTRLVYAMLSLSILCYLARPMMLHNLMAEWFVAVLDFAVSFVGVLFLLASMLTLNGPRLAHPWFKFLLIVSAVLNTLHVFQVFLEIDRVIGAFALSFQFFCLGICVPFAYKLIMSPVAGRSRRYDVFATVLMFVIVLFVLADLIVCTFMFDGDCRINLLVLILVVCVTVPMNVRLLIYEKLGSGQKLELYASDHEAARMQSANSTLGTQLSSIHTSIAHTSIADVPMCHGATDFVSEQPATAHAKTHAEAIEADIVQRRLYADMNLRIGGLALKLGVPEYRLRSMVLKDLGAKNINQYINTLRINDVKQQIIANPRLPFLSISLDVGFKSISAFNIAFQRVVGMTPSEYRASILLRNKAGDVGAEIHS